MADNRMQHYMTSELETVARPFLDLMHMVTGLESTYLTEIDERSGVQTVRFAQNRGSMTIGEGLKVDWNETLCKRSIESRAPVLQNVGERFGDLDDVNQLGIDTYIGVPVRSGDNELVGTLCGASQRATEIDPEVVAIMEMFAGLISERWESDRQSRRLTERVRQAEERIKNRATFLAAAEHKLKSPVTVIRGWAEELEDNWEASSDDVRRKGVAVIARAAAQLTSQVNDLLEEARSEAVATDLSDSKIDAVVIIHGAVSDLDAASAAHEVRSDVEGSVWVHADANALWHALIHLIENAIKYSPEGGAIVVSARQSGERVTIDVVDEGVGIPEDVDIFEPFVRAVSGGLESTAGSGLGLHVVRTLMQAMGGEVTARRNAGRGSTFTLELRAF